MGLVSALIGFGIAIIGFGLFFSLIDDILASEFQWMILNNKYYVLCDLIWHSLPFITIILGVLCLIGAGVLHSRGTRRVIYE